MALHQGYLTKLGGSRKNWKRRYFVLREALVPDSPRLEYYKNEKMKEAPLGIIPLSNVTISKTGPRRIEVATFHRLYVCVADTEAEAETWSKMLRSKVEPGKFSLKEKGFEKEGWLEKQGDTVKSWKKRWFVLKDFKLQYYRNEQQSDALGCIYLDRALEVKFSASEPTKFAIVTSARTFQIEGEDSSAVAEWVSTLNACLAYLLGNTTQDGAQSDDGDDGEVVPGDESIFRFGEAAKSNENVSKRADEAQEHVPPPTMPPNLNNIAALNALDDMLKELEGIGSSAPSPNPTKPAASPGGPIHHAPVSEPLVARPPQEDTQIVLIPPVDPALAMLDTSTLIRKLTEGVDSDDPKAVMRICYEITERSSKDPLFKEALRREGGCPILVELLTPSPGVHMAPAERSVKYHALRALVSICDTDSIRSDIYRADVIPRLVNIVRKETIRLRKLAVKVIQNLCCTELVFIHSDMRNAGVIKTLVELLTAPLGDGTEDIRATSLKALMNLSANDANQEALVATGVLPVLCFFLEDGQKKSTQRLTSFILCNLATNDNLKDTIRLAGGIKPLSKMLLDDFEEGRVEASKALVNLSNHSLNQEVMRKEGVIANLSSLLSSSNMDTVFYALWALSNIAAHEQGRQDLYDTGGVQGIIKYLSHENEAIRLRAAWATANFCLNDRNRMGVKQSNGVKPLISLLAISKSTETALHSVKALANLAVDEYLREEIYVNGGCPALVGLLELEDKSLIDFAVIALLNLSLNAKCRDAMREINALPILLKLCQTPVDPVASPWFTENLQVNILKVLTNLAYNDVNRQVLLNASAPQTLTRIQSVSQFQSVVDQINHAQKMLSIPVDMALVTAANSSNALKHPQPELGVAPDRPSDEVFKESGVVWAKCTFGGNVKVVKCTKTTTLDDLHARIRERFALVDDTPVRVQYRDISGDLIAIETLDDWQYSLADHLEAAKGDAAAKIGLIVSTLQNQ